MIWPDFLGALGKKTHITLVGPVLTGAPKSLEGPVVYVDGGAKYRVPGGLSVAVGDGDSGDAALDHCLPAAKDYSDLAFVLRELPGSVNSLRLFGFWGGRPDHHMINFGEVHSFLKQRPTGTRVEWCDDTSVKAIGANGELTVTVQGPFSLITLEATRVALTGACTYQLAEPTLFLPLSSYGLSNEGHGPVHISGEGPYFIFLNVGG